METSNQKTPKALNIVLWIAQLVLAAMFLMAGFTKVATPFDQLALRMSWASQVPAEQIRFIGLTEIAGALGLLLPSAFRIKPDLTILAAICLGLVMVGAVVFHISRGEFPAVPMNIVLIAIAVFIAWGRSKKAAIQARS
jgi:putative oxidoreductase